MTIYKFERSYRNKVYSVKEIEVEEKPKTYVSYSTPFSKSFISKGEINTLSLYGTRMYCLENNPKIFIKALIDNTNRSINSLEKELNNKKEELKKFEKALNECGVSGNGG